MYLILWHDKHVMIIVRLIFGHIWRISRRCLPPTLVISYTSHWLIPRCCCCSSFKKLSWDWHIHHWLVICHFSAMWPSLVPGRQFFFGLMYLARAASGESGLLKCLQLLFSTPQNTCARQSAPTFSSCSLMFSKPAFTASTPHLWLGPTYWYPAAAVAPLPSDCLETDTFINRLLHASFQPCDLVWFPEVGQFWDTRILLVMLLVKADCWISCSYRLVLPKTHAPYNPPPQFPPAHSFLVTQIVPRPCPLFVAPSFETMSSGTRNKSTALNSLCRMTLEVGIIFSETFSEFLGLYDWCAVFLAQPSPSPKFLVRSNQWKP